MQQERGTYKERLEAGWKEEPIFKKSVEKYLKIGCEKSPKEDDWYKHIDFYLSNGWSVDVKAQKKVNSIDTELSWEYVWVELKNKNGNKGWIDGKATHIVFALGNEYIFVRRLELRKLVKDNLRNKQIFRKNNNPNIYVKYNREPKYDEVVLVPIKDILKLSHFKMQRINVQDQDK